MLAAGVIDTIVGQEKRNMANLLEGLYYVGVLHFLLSEATIFGDLLQSVIPYYSPSVVSVALLMAFLLVYVVMLRKVSLPIGLPPEGVFAFVSMIFFLVAITVDFALSVITENSMLAALYWVKYGLFCAVMLVAVFGANKIDILRPCYHILLMIMTTSIALLVIVSVVGGDLPSIGVSFLRKSGEGNLGEPLYSFPYGLGLLITGQNEARVLGFEFSQYCSYFIEPQIFAFFYVPAMFLCLDRFASKTLAFLAGLVLVVWAHSLTSLLSICLLVVVYAYTSKPVITLLVSLSTMASIFLVLDYDYGSLVAIQDGFSMFQKLSSSSADATQGRIQAIFTEFSMLGRPLNLRFGASDIDAPVSVLSLGAWLLMIVTAFASAMVSFITKRNVAIASALVFMTFAAPKSLEHSPQSVIFIFSVVVCLWQSSQLVENKQGLGDS